MNAIDEMITNEFLNYWGFEKIPFPKVCDPANTFLNARYDHALKRLNQLLYTREIGVVIGEAGNGKSTLMDILLSKISSTRYKIIPISVPQNKPRELYRSISAAMGVNTSWFGAGSNREIFLPATKKAIFRRSQGNPRMINRLGWESLNKGCLDGVDVITEELFCPRM